MVKNSSRKSQKEIKKVLHQNNILVDWCCCIDRPILKDLFLVMKKNYMTPAGFKLLQNELRVLLDEERPKVVEAVSWAAKNGDRSENGDYIYGKRRLREIDRRVRYLTKQLSTAEIIDPKQQQHLTRVYFGATVTYQYDDGKEETVKIVGVDEADLNNQKINWLSPLAQALLKSAVGDTVSYKTPMGKKTSIHIIEITYPIS